MPNFYYLTCLIREARSDIVEFILSPIEVLYLSSRGIELKEKVGEDGICRYSASVSSIRATFAIW